MPRDKTMLTVMRLANMHKVHPQMTTAYNCDLCGEQTGIYPSGQKVIKQLGRNNVVIVCDVCAGPNAIGAPAPGALEEVGQSTPVDPTKKQ
jgi:transcription elongation factor Elf1